LREISSMNESPRKHITAWLPLAMSLAALLMVLLYAAIYGVVKEADEGTPAHVFQLLMGAQIPFMAYFAFRWSRRKPRQSFPILALQVMAWLAAFAAAYWLT
jgi:hypothetical protein